MGSWNNTNRFSSKSWSRAWWLFKIQKNICHWFGALVTITFVTKTKQHWFQVNWTIATAYPRHNPRNTPHNTECMGKKHCCLFRTAETGKRIPNSSVESSGANNYPWARWGFNFEEGSKKYKLGLKRLDHQAFVGSHCDVKKNPGIGLLVCDVGHQKHTEANFMNLDLNNNWHNPSRTDISPYYREMRNSWLPSWSILPTS